MNDGLDDRERGGEGEGDSRVNSAGGSHALHFATKRLRASLMIRTSDVSFLTWAPYVHFGY